MMTTGKIFTLVAVLAFLARTAHAQEPAPPRLDLKPYAVYYASVAADLTTTYRFLEHGYQEANPIGAWLEDRPKTLVAFSVGTDIATVYILHRLVGRHHPRLEKTLLYGAAAVRFSLAAHNWTLVDPSRKGR